MKGIMSAHGAGGNFLMLNHPISFTNTYSCVFSTSSGNNFAACAIAISLRNLSKTQVYSWNTSSSTAQEREMYLLCIGF